MGWRGSGCLLVEFEIQDYIFAAVVAGNRAGLRLGSVFFRVQLVVRIGIESAEAIVTCFVADVAADGIGAHILQKDDTSGDGRFRLVEHLAAHGAQLGFVFGILRGTAERQTRQQDQQGYEATECSHFFLSGSSMRKTRVSSLKPLEAFTFCVASAKPLDCTMIS